MAGSDDAMKLFINSVNQSRIADSQREKQSSSKREIKKKQMNVLINPLNTKDKLFNQSNILSLLMLPSVHGVASFWVYKDKNDPV